MNMKMPTTYTLHPTGRMVPFHGTEDLNKLGWLIEAMQANGWQGRPLLGVLDNSGTMWLLTGSHRFEAAKRAELDRIPVYYLECSTFGDKDWFRSLVTNCVDGDDTIHFLRECKADRHFLELLSDE